MDGRRMRRRIAAAIGGTALAGLAVGVALALAGGFDYRDGDTVGGADWDAVYAGTAAVDATSFTADNDYWGELTLFTGGGSKDINDVSMWAWRTVGQPPDKTDLLHAMAAYDESAGSGGTPQLYFAADRYATNGDAKVGFWFFQNEIALNTSTYRFDGTHSTGDILVEATFTKGGRVDTINVYRWTGTGLSMAGVDGGDCEDSGYAGYDVCATVNDAEIDPAWSYAGKFSGGMIAKGGFIEGALDLTALFGSNTPCFSSFLAETRSAGSSITSELKDFVLGDFDTCGTLTIVKEIAGDSTSFTFSTDLTPSSFSLADGGSRTFDDIRPGTYEVSETVTAGYELYDVTCDAPAGDWEWDDATTLSVDIAEGDDITCTFYNGEIPEVRVVKDLYPAADPGRFDLLVNGIVRATGVGDGGTTGFISVSTGETTVAEEASTGTDLGDYASRIDCDSGEMTSGTSLTLTLDWGDEVTCTVTNSRNPALKVVKDLYPADDPGRFNLLIDDVVYATGVGDGGATAFIELSAGSHEVSEEASTGTYLSDYRISVSCDNGDTGSGASLTVTLDPGEIVTCTITNEKRMSTRSQGFWSTHPTLAALAWGTSQPIAGCRTVATSTTAGEDDLMGGFWASVSTRSTGQKRSPIDQARMTLLQQLLAAKLNNLQFGSVPTGSISIAQAEAAYCGGTMSQVKQAAAAMGYFNESGTGTSWSPGMSADPQEAQRRADVDYWDSLP